MQNLMTGVSPFGDRNFLSQQVKREGSLISLSAISGGGTSAIDAVEPTPSKANATLMGSSTKK